MHGTSLHTNILIIDTFSIGKDYRNNYDELTRITTIPQVSFLDLENLVLIATWYTYNSQFHQHTNRVAIGR